MTDLPAVAGARPVRAPRGTTLSCKGWPQEAALRMLMNNLDPEVAEHPDQLIVYGGSGRAARSWAAFDGIVASLRDLEADETLLVQSGKPVGIFRTHEWAPRVLIANSNLVPQWATWEEFRRLEAAGAHDVRPDDGRARGSTSVPRAYSRAPTRRLLPSPPSASAARWPARSR